MAHKPCLDAGGCDVPLIGAKAVDGSEAKYVILQMNGSGVTRPLVLRDTPDSKRYYDFLCKTTFNGSCMPDPTGQ
jgi:hypothetical protein